MWCSWFCNHFQNCCTCEGHCCWICHWPGKFILCSCVWEWDENDPEPRSFVHVACSCTYMFAIFVRDVAALLNAAVHKFSAGVSSSQNLRVLHVFFFWKLNVIVHCLKMDATCLSLLVWMSLCFFVILLSLLVNLLTAIIIMQTLYKTLVW